ncbi:MAG: hypothetical protein F4Z31_03350 [Gemmatimonadetes bacterium]|nr:hypothetical protein [Gemmatimonadota bacterium]MYE94851.1 hypothetical protein [Gemmatimonadota bacterium]MYJ10071.1 hypothetical protein [Gemmatimonadota bacterium]
MSGSTEEQDSAKSRGRPEALEALGRVSPATRRPYPQTALSDEELLQEIRTVLKASPFLGEGHRRAKARLAARGIRVGTAPRTSSAGTLRRRATAGRRWLQRHGYMTPARAREKFSRRAA